jgi:hypothetical protein
MIALDSKKSEEKRGIISITLYIIYLPYSILSYLLSTLKFPFLPLYNYFSSIPFPIISLILPFSTNAIVREEKGVWCHEVV